MKIAIDPGHNCRPDIGCNGLFPKFPREDELTLELANRLIEILEAQGHNCLLCLPIKASSVTSSLQQRAQMANRFDADFYLSIHFNCFNGSVQGSEAFAISTAGRKYAQNILDEILLLGYRDRKVKNNPYYVLRATNMPAVLLEVCFCDNEDDMTRYDLEKVAQAIATGILK